MKRFLSRLFVLPALLLIFSTSVYAYTDVNETTEHANEITEFTNRGLLKGYPDGTFRPLTGLRRSEFITLINRTFGYIDGGKSINFNDVGQDAWYYGALQIAVGKGYIQGYPDGTFRPDKLITRQEAAVVINRILGYQPTEYTSTTDEIQSWALSAVQSLLQYNIMTLNAGAFRGEDVITRTETVVSLLTVVQQREATEAEDQEMSNGGSTGTNGSTDTSDEDTVVLYALQITVDQLDKVLAGTVSYAEGLDEEQLKIIGDIRESIVSYLDNQSYDYEADIELVKVDFYALSTAEQEGIKDVLQVSVPFQYSSELRSFFDF